MRVDKEMKLSGYFWTPGNEAGKAPGTLSIQNGGKAELEVVGTLEVKPGGFGLPTLGDGQVRRIIGHVERHGYVTLEDCHLAERNISLHGISKSRMSCAFVLLGVAFDCDKEILVDSCRFSTD